MNSGSRGRGHNAWFLPITAISLHILSQNFTGRLPSSQRYAYYIIFQDQLTRSHSIYYKKWSPAQNCIPFTPILKLYTHTPHESGKSPFAFNVKRSEVKVTGIQSFLLPIFMKLVTQTPHKARMTIIICGIKSQF